MKNFINHEWSGLKKYLLEVFFEKVILEVGIKDLKEALIIGDSLTSDIQGGHNIGIDTCWYNPKNEENTTLLSPTYTIRNLHELENII